LGSNEKFCFQPPQTYTIFACRFPRFPPQLAATIQICHDLPTCQIKRKIFDFKIKTAILSVVTVDLGNHFSTIDLIFPATGGPSADTLPPQLSPFYHGFAVKSNYKIRIFRLTSEAARIV
jgi:hypothetical protein